MNDELFIAFVSHNETKLIKPERRIGVYYLSKVLSGKNHLYDYRIIRNAFTDKSHFVFTIDLYESQTYPLIAQLPNDQFIRNSFLLCGWNYSRFNRSWMKALTKEEILQTAKEIDYIDISGKNKGSDYICNQLTSQG